KDYFDLDFKKDERIIIYSAICNSAVIGKKITGNPIDVAIMETFLKMNKKFKFEKIDEVPFDYERRRMSVLAKVENEYLLITKGSPESMIKVCSKIGKEKITKEKEREIMKKYEEISARGLRCIVVGFKKVKGRKKIEKKDENGLTFLGFIVFEDPPKRTIKQTLALAKKFGVNIKIITGDGPTVTKTVLKEVGIDVKEDEIVVGSEIDELIEKRSEKIEKAIVFARATPEQKYKILKLLREKHTVAYLGDGVNDAPPLLEADVGISVENGSDAAKETADIILTKKSLHSIVDGIIYGRIVFSNIVKYLNCTFAGNFGNLFTVAIASSFLKFVPLLPTQILLANFVTDTPLLAISGDKVDEEELVSPKKWDVRKIINNGIIYGSISTIFDLILIFFIINASEKIFQTNLFLEIVFSEVFVILSLRSNRVFIKSKPSLELTIAIIFVAIVGFLSIFPPLVEIFNFEPIGLEELLLPISIAVFYCIATEIAKFFIVKSEKTREKESSVLSKFQYTKF
ncbi:MAG: HAD-IC family P-type ATPase, partial [Candidatus Aenigmatarchaeota archaeon]